MNNEQTQTLSLKAAYSFGVSHGLESDVNEIRNMVIEWDSSYTSSLRRGYIVSLFENRGIFEDFNRKRGQDSLLKSPDPFDLPVVGQMAHPASASVA